MATATRGFAQFQEGSEGIIAWHDLENVALLDEAYAWAEVPVPDQPRSLRPSGVPAGSSLVPDTAEITGIELRFSCYAEPLEAPGNIYCRFETVQLIYGGIIQAYNPAELDVFLVPVGKENEAYLSFGGPGMLWLEGDIDEWTPDMLNSDPLGFLLQFVADTGLGGTDGITVYVNHAELIVHYSSKGPYNVICDRLIEVLESERTDALSQGIVSGLVTVIAKGEYLPSESSAKPIIYVRPELPALIADMAGNMRRQERMLHRITGAVVADTQAEAIDDACSLVNNIQNLLMHYGNDTYWAGGHLGFRYASDENPEEMGGFFPDHGTENCVVHFRLWWSCDFFVDREAL